MTGRSGGTTKKSGNKGEKEFNALFNEMGGVEITENSETLGIVGFNVKRSNFLDQAKKQ